MNAFLSLILILLCSSVFSAEIERRDYKIITPTGATIDPEDDDLDLNHFTTININEDVFVIILIIDDIKTMEVAKNKMVESYKEKMENPVEIASQFKGVEKYSGSALSGKVNGIKYVFDVTT
jgi:hypothetical protein